MVHEDAVYDNTVLGGNRTAVGTSVAQALGAQVTRTMYPIDRRRIAYKIYTLYCTERGGLHSSIKSVIPQYSDA